MTSIEVTGILLEIVLGLMIVGIMWHVADADNRSPILWNLITVAICIASVALPVPVVRLFFAGGLVLCAMFVTNLTRLPPL